MNKDRRVQGVLDERIFGAALLALAGWTLADVLIPHSSYSPIGVLVGLILGFVLTPTVVRVPRRIATARLSGVSTDVFFVTILGLGIGLIFSSFLAIPLYMLPKPQGYWLPLFSTVLITYMSVQLSLLRRDDISRALAARSAGAAALPADRIESLSDETPQVLLDTSAIIDGRIADISQTGFISGTLVIPRFVLDELQHIADSPDVLRRNRGRRGLDMLNKLRKESVTPIKILDADVRDIQEVDSKLVHLAKTLHCPIITQDFNLNKVAELQGVIVLNINQLANAVKPLVLPGEEMAVHIIQPGKELNQGVGYLDDGTMIVVEDGQRYINRDVEIVVTRVLQTVAGRMIFAHPKLGHNGRETNRDPRDYRDR